MINAETYRLAVKMICDGRYTKDDPCYGCPICEVALYGGDVTVGCMVYPDYNGDGSPIPIVEKWLNDHPDKAAEINKAVKELEDEDETQMRT